MRHQRVNPPSAPPGSFSLGVAIALCVGMLVIAGVWMWQRPRHHEEDASASAVPIAQVSPVARSTPAPSGPAFDTGQHFWMQLQELRAASDPNQREKLIQAFLADVSP